MNHDMFNPYTRMDFSNVESEAADLAAASPDLPTLFTYSSCVVINGVDKHFFP
ncbi:MAG: hypothetical protein AAGA02_14320 [Bacteroidota bacterium]